ncbi:MAG TPA: DUF4097 family beta strand repeat-containing protein, partial [Thermoanaerobaculia bacterium]
GTITVIGTNSPGLEVEAVKIIRGIDDRSIREGKLQTEIEILGNAQVRTIRTTGSSQPVAVRGGRWAAVVNYVVRVPRSVNVSVFNFTGERVRIENVAGKILVQNTNGRVELIGTSGSVVANTVNGDVIASYSARPTSSAAFQTINGTVELRVPRGSKFRWIAESLRGHVMTTLPIQGSFDPRGSGRKYRGTIAGAQSPTITTTTMAGNVYVLEGRADRQTARILVPPRPTLGGPSPDRDDFDIAATSRDGVRTIAKELITTDFRFITTLGNVAIGEIQGNALVRTQAGEVQLELVSGQCEVISGGGPLRLGDIRGPLHARTEAGDIIVRTARKGGILHTQGGNIDVQQADGRLELSSGGGNITVRRIHESVQAETKSGDIVLTIDPSSKSERLFAKTTQGNVVINIPKGFAADLDATILTTNPSQHSIISDIPGISILQDKIGSRTRIRAVGPVNGGGKRVELVVEEGNIHIRRQ